MMRKFILVVLLAVFLLNNLAYAGNLGQEIGEAIADAAIKIVSVSLKEQILLYALCTFYYLKFRHWPKNKAEFIAALKDIDAKSKEEISTLMNATGGSSSGADDIKKEIDSFGQIVYYEFYPLPGGDLLIEGGFTAEFEKEFTSAGFGKCLFSTVARKTKEGFSFAPSDKAKGNRDYLSPKITFKIDKPFL